MNIDKFEHIALEIEKQIRTHLNNLSGSNLSYIIYNHESIELPQVLFSRVEFYPHTTMNEFNNLIYQSYKKLKDAFKITSNNYAGDIRLSEIMQSATSNAFEIRVFGSLVDLDYLDHKQEFKNKLQNIIDN